MKRDMVRAALIGVGSLFLIWLGLHSAAHSEATATLLGLSQWPFADRIYWGGLALAVLVGGGSSAWLLRAAVRLCLAAPWFGRPGRAEAGTVMVEFTLIFPFLYLAMGLTVQAALVAHATIVVRYAAFSAARSAIVRTEYSSTVSLTESLYATDEAKRAAVLVLASLSPEAPAGGGAADAVAIRTMFQNQAGPWGSRAYPARVTYAVAATQVSLSESPASLLPETEDLIPPFGGLIPVPSLPSSLSIPQISGYLISPQSVTAKVDYKLLCVVPGLPAWIGIVSPAPAGVGGTVFTVSQSVRLQSAGARQSGLASVVPLFGNTPLP